MQQFIITNNWMFLIGFGVSLSIMLITDYLLGEEAEFLNAWAIITSWLKWETGIAPSLVMQKLGLAGATMVMLIANFIGGSLLVVLTRIITRLFV